MMHFLTERVKEGYVAFVFGLKDNENPYDKNDLPFWEWETGWLIAKHSEAKVHPDEIGKDTSPPYEPNRTTEEFAKLTPEQLSAQYAEIAKYFVATEYFTWLESIDPRVKEVILALDTEEPSGMVGARQMFQGEMEAMLLARCTDGEDFIKMYVELVSGPHGMDKQFHREEAARIWNIVVVSVKHYLERSYGQQKSS